MPQIIIHSEIDGRARNKATLVQELRGILQETLQLSPQLGQVFLYETEPVFRAVDPERKGMVFVEVKLMRGRPETLKRSLADQVSEVIAEKLDIPKNKVLCLLEEYESRAYVGGVPREVKEDT